MPPSPIIKPLLNLVLWHKLVVELELVNNEPEVTLKTTSGGQYLGHAEYGNPTKITMYFGNEMWENMRLSLAMTECSRTLLHEARHAWQDANHPADWFDPDTVEYSLRKQEIDAESFAHKRCDDYKTLVRLVRTHPSSSFSRLGATERKVRA